MKNIHPKTSGSALGASFGVMLAAILHSVHGVHLDPSVYGAITGFLGVAGAWLAPSPTTEVTPVASNLPTNPVAVKPAPVVAAPLPASTPLDGPGA